MKTSVLLADDHTIIREGLRALLAIEPWIQIIGEAATGLEVLDKAAELAPNVVVMDIDMPELNGIDATALLTERHPGSRVVILSVHSTSEHLYRAFQAGAYGYILKESAGRELVAAIRSAHCRKQYMSCKIRDELPEMTTDLHRHFSPLERLSIREKMVLQMVVEGGTSSHIAKKLSLSPKTVETYRCRIMQKLEIKDLPALVKFAIQHGLASLK
jgi:DNA-binding NarL/FixJ family response regulator